MASPSYCFVFLVTEGKGEGLSGGVVSAPASPGDDRWFESCRRPRSPSCKDAYLASSGAGEENVARSDADCTRL